MSTVHELGLRALDLNLLVVLDALLETGSVTASARKLGRTQSAVSHALSRLRDLFDDPLFVRSGRGVVATPRADALRPSLRAVLIDLERLIGGSDAFDPATSTRSFRMACPDLFEALVFPTMLAGAQQDAPGVSLVAMPMRGLPFSERLRTGELDLALLPVGEGQASPAPTELQSRTLFRDGLVVYLREGHPALRDGVLTLDAYASARHLLVTIEGRGMGPVDHALEALGRSRHVAARIRSFLSAPFLLAGSDLVLTAPASLRTLLPPGIVSVPAPLPVPGHRLDLLWHPRMGADAGHRWFRERVRTSLGS